MRGTYFTNVEVARLLRSVAAAYTVRHGNQFQITAYENAADAIEHATSEVKDLWDEDKLAAIPGIGSHLAGYLDELFRTGKVAHFEQVMKKVPKAMFALLDIPGVGPKTALKLAKIGVKNIPDLQKKLQNGELEHEGISEKIGENILQGVKAYAGRNQRMLLPYATTIAERVLDYLKKSPHCKRVDPLGSLRRQVSTVGDIDFAVASDQSQAVIDHLVQYPQVLEVKELGEHQASVVLKNGIQIDLMVQPVEHYGSLLQHFTGSKQHNIHLRKIAQEKGLSLSEYGIKKELGHNKSKLIPCETEEKLYQQLNLAWIPPELREDTGEIEAAAKQALPILVELKDIKGDFHLHSDYPIDSSHDYGTCSMEELVKRAIALDYHYIALSDHSPAVSRHTPQEISELINKRTQIIQQLQKKYSGIIKVLNSLEIDILSDGTLSVSDQLLATLDVVLAGVHSSMRQSESVMTKRILKAVENPHVDIITHPTGRLLNERESYETNWGQIIATCVETKTVLEINAWPERLDLPDLLVRDAVRAGVKMVINTDAHALEHLLNMRFGVSVARRGWATKKDIINTWNWVDITRLFGIE